MFDNYVNDSNDKKYRKEDINNTLVINYCPSKLVSKKRNKTLVNKTKFLAKL